MNELCKISIIVVLCIMSISVVNATWCDTDFAKRINVSVNNTAGSTLTDYQVYVNLTTNPINETSIRVYNATSCTLRPHWCENVTSGNCYGVWINYSAINASGWTNDTSIYFDNDIVNSMSNGSTTFNFFDDFSNGLSKWTFSDVSGSGGSASIVSGKLKIISKSGNKHIGKTTTTFQTGILEVDMEGYPDANYQWSGSGFGSSETNFIVSQLIWAGFLKARAEWNTGSGYSSNGTIGILWTTWYSKVVLTGSVAKAYGRESRTDAWSVFKSDLSYSSTVPVRVGSNDDNVTGDGIAYFDNIRIRSYNVSEPSTTLGSEEELPVNVYNVSGYVKTSLGAPIENAYVSNNVTSATNYTNASGYYILSLPNATYSVSASKSLYVTNSTTFTISGAGLTNQNITLNDQLCHRPPTPTNLQNTSGAWINWTWQAGTGNITDSYNVSVTGENWINGSSNTFYNKTNVCPGQSITISVYAFNHSKSDCISNFNVTDTQSIDTLLWANSNYDYRAIACVQNITTGNYQINFSLHTGTGTNNATDIFMNNHNETSNYSDIRIYNQTGTALCYWIQNTSVDPTTIWINATENGSIQIYYGDSDATYASNGTETFEFFDDFNTDSPISIIMTEEPSNPTRTADDAWEQVSPGVLCEQNDFNYSGEYISWYRAGAYNTGYENSTDAISWTPDAGNPVLPGTSMQYVVQDGDKFYLFTVQNGDMYLYNATNHTNITIMNSGNPVYTHSSTASDWDYRIFNPGVAIDSNGKWHMLLEGMSSASTFRIGYAYSNLTEMDWTAHRSSSYVISSAGNPYLTYVAERNALLAIHGDNSGGTWKIISHYANISDDLTQSSSWHAGSNFEKSVSGIHIADPDLIENFNATYPMMMSYNYAQTSTYQDYLNVNKLQFYDIIKGGEDPLSSWTVRGSMTIIDNELDMPSNTESDLSPTYEIPYSGINYIYEFTFKNITGARVQPILAYINDNNFVRIWTGYGSSITRFQEMVGGVFGSNTELGANNAIDGIWHDWKIIKTRTQVTLYIDGSQIGTPQSLNAVFNTDTKIGISGHTTAGRWDDVRIRKYASLMPSISLGSEEQLDGEEGTTPVISNVINGSISFTSQYVDWDVNQTAHNRVLYSNESDLTPAWYSTWDNSTAAPNITLSTLEASTQYWYQAWSYNTTNTSLSDNSSTVYFISVSNGSISNITTTAITNESIVIQWDTTVACTGQVEWGVSNAYGTGTDVEGAGFFHTFHITGLNNDTTYHYKINAVSIDNIEANSSDRTFTTLTDTVFENTIKSARTDGQMPKTYYIKTSGDNTSDGLSVGTAWQNLTYAVSQVDAGDTIYVVDGVWTNEFGAEFTTSGIDIAHIKLVAYNGTPTFIGNGDLADATNVCLKNAESISYIDIEGLTCNDYAYPFYFYKAWNQQSSTEINVMHCNVNNTESAFVGGQLNHSSVSDCVFSNSGWNMIYLYEKSNYFRVYNNTLHGSPGLTGRAGHNLVDVNYGAGQEARYISVYNNTGYNCSYAFFYPHGATTTNYITIRNNVMYDITYGVELINVNDTVVINNVINDTWMAMIGQNFPFEGIFKDNIITHSKYGISYQTSLGTIVNTYNCYYDITQRYFFDASEGTGEIVSDPYFADKANYDYHIKSQIGRWNGTDWVADSVSSPCIDTGDPNSPYLNEPTPNGSRINMGAYGNTVEASKYTETTTPSISNIQNGSVSATSQYVNATINQTANNVVIYDTGATNATSTACAGQWSATHACANASDGNWSSYAESSGALLAYAYFNHTVPTSTNQPESLWHVKDAAGHANVTIPSACWGTTLYLRAMCSDTGNSITWQCDDGSGWTTLHSAVANIAYEEEMNFKYKSAWDNATAAPNITLTSLTPSTAYNFYVRACNTTITSICSNSSTYTFTTAAENTYIPPDPTTLANTTGNFWVNHTWNNGTGNVTNSYNVSWNLTWYNTTTDTFMKKEVGASNWGNITVYAYNSSGNGSLSASSISSDTQAGGSTYTTYMTTTVYNLVSYYGSANSTAEQFGDDITNVDYVARYNNVNNTFTTHIMGTGGNNFTTVHGRGYFVYVNASGSSTYNRNNISDSAYYTTLSTGWDVIGWTNATDTNAEGLIHSLGSACKYTSMLNVDGWSYTTHTSGFTINNHDVDKGKGYWVWVNTNTNWNRNS